MYRKFYTIEMVDRSKKIDKEFDTYREAYDYMCKNYIRELNEGQTPTLYQILRHSMSDWNGTTNTMIQPTWSE